MATTARFELQHNDDDELQQIIDNVLSEFEGDDVSRTVLLLLISSLIG